jgi:predicted amidohydrolase
MTPVAKPRVALIQSHWKGDPDESLAGLLRLVDSIPGPTELICLPEFFLGAPWYFPGRSHLKGKVDQTIPGPITDLLADVARRRKSYIVCGTLVERDGDRYYNTCAVLDSEGRLVGKARKVHRFSAEMLAIDAGSAQLLVDTPFGKLGICVCSDFWITEMPRMLAINGAEIIAVPGAAIRSNLAITRPCIQANSSFNVCYTLFAGIVGSVTGTRGGRQVSIELGGRSTVAGPEAIMATLDEEEAVLMATLDMDYLRESRTVDLSFRRSLYWCLHGRQPELYGDLRRAYVGSSDLKTLLSGYLS